MANFDVPGAASSPPTTTAQLSYQYDLIDDPNNLYGDSESNEARGLDYSYSDMGSAASYLDGDDESGKMMPAMDALVSERGDDALTQANESIDYPSSGQQFSEMMKSRTSESNEFRVMIVCVGLVIVSIGILANLVFSLLMVYKRRRTRRPSSSLLFMTAMSVVYFLYLIFYCIKISVYFSGDNIIKCKTWKTLFFFNERQCLLLIFNCKLVC